jgi:hypothetical protein
MPAGTMCSEAAGKMLIEKTDSLLPNTPSAETILQIKLFNYLCPVMVLALIVSTRD